MPLMLGQDEYYPSLLDAIMNLYLLLNASATVFRWMPFDPFIRMVLPVGRWVCNSAMRVGASG